MARLISRCNKQNSVEQGCQTHFGSGATYSQSDLKWAGPVKYVLIAIVDGGGRGVLIAIVDGGGAGRDC